MERGWERGRVGGDEEQVRTGQGDSAWGFWWMEGSM